MTYTGVSPSLPRALCFFHQDTRSLAVVQHVKWYHARETVICEKLALWLSTGRIVVKSSVCKHTNVSIFSRVAYTIPHHNLKWLWLIARFSAKKHNTLELERVFDCLSNIFYNKVLIKGLLNHLSTSLSMVSFALSLSQPHPALKKKSAFCFILKCLFVIEGSYRCAPFKIDMSWLSNNSHYLSDLLLHLMKWEWADLQY